MAIFPVIFLGGDKIPQGDGTLCKRRLSPAASVRLIFHAYDVLGWVELIRKDSIHGYPGRFLYI
jgi:hypothetical protein